MPTNDPIKNRAYQKNYRQSEKGKAYRSKYNKEYNKSQKHKEWLKTYRQSEKYRAYHRECVREYQKTEKYKEYIKNRPIQNRLAHNLRVRLNHALKGRAKSGSSIKDLGCSLEELKLYLESRFQPGMNWDNHKNRIGCWSIDHIIPLSKFDLTNREEFLKANHYTNLTPIWHVDNSKKGNRV